MRIQLCIDGASTEQVRQLAVQLHRVGLTGELEVGCDGPELWSARTPKMRPNQHAQVMAALVKFNGQPIADALDALREAGA